jgi:putative membrane protein
MTGDNNDRAAEKNASSSQSARERTDLARTRVHLANERTALAWVRTALAVMTFGFLVEKIQTFIDTETGAKAAEEVRQLGHLSITAFILGGLIILVSWLRFYMVRRTIPGGGRLPVWPDALLYLAVAAMVFYLVSVQK